jgi:hypothetical protein
MFVADVLTDIRRVIRPFGRVIIPSHMLVISVWWLGAVDGQQAATGYKVTDHECKDVSSAGDNIWHSCKLADGNRVSPSSRVLKLIDSCSAG